MNYKIAKILANALNWEIDFNALGGAKQIVKIPLDGQKSSAKTNKKNAASK